MLDRVLLLLLLLLLAGNKMTMADSATSHKRSIGGKDENVLQANSVDAAVT